MTINTTENAAPERRVMDPKVEQLIKTCCQLARSLSTAETGSFDRATEFCKRSQDAWGDIFHVHRLVGGYPQDRIKALRDCLLLGQEKIRTIIGSPTERDAAAAERIELLRRYAENIQMRIDNLDALMRDDIETIRRNLDSAFVHAA